MRAKELEDVRKYITQWNTFTKARKIGITLSAHDYTREQIDAFYIIETKIASLKVKDGK